jgi:hypothetical protein
MRRGDNNYRYHNSVNTTNPFLTEDTDEEDEEEENPFNITAHYLRYQDNMSDSSGRSDMIDGFTDEDMDRLVFTNGRAQEDVDFQEFVRRHHDIQIQKQQLQQQQIQQQKKKISPIKHTLIAQQQTLQRNVTNDQYQISAAHAEIRSLKTQLQSTKHKLSEKNEETKKLSDELDRKQKQYLQNLHGVTAKSVGRQNSSSVRKRPTSTSQKKPSPPKRTNSNISFDSSLPQSKRGLSPLHIEREIENLNVFEQQLKDNTWNEDSPQKNIETPQLSPTTQDEQKLKSKLSSALKEKELMEAQFERLLQHTQKLANTVTAMRTQQPRSVSSPSKYEGMSKVQSTNDVESPVDILSQILLNASSANIIPADIGNQNPSGYISPQLVSEKQSQKSLPSSPLQQPDRKTQQKSSVKPQSQVQPEVTKKVPTKGTPTRSTSSTSTKSKKISQAEKERITVLTQLKGKIHGIKEKYAADHNEEQKQEEKQKIVASIANLMNTLLEAEHAAHQNDDYRQEKIAELTETLKSFIIEEISQNDIPIDEMMPSPIKSESISPIRATSAMDTTQEVFDKQSYSKLLLETVEFRSENERLSTTLEEKTRTLKQLLAENLTVSYWSNNYYDGN